MATLADGLGHQQQQHRPERDRAAQPVKQEQARRFLPSDSEIRLRVTAPPDGLEKYYRQASLIGCVVLCSRKPLMGATDEGD